MHNKLEINIHETALVGTLLTVIGQKHALKALFLLLAL